MCNCASTLLKFELRFGTAAVPDVRAAGAAALRSAGRAVVALNCGVLSVHPDTARTAPSSRAPAVPRSAETRHGRTACRPAPAMLWHRPAGTARRELKACSVYLVRRRFIVVCRHRSSVYTTLRGSLRVFSPGLCHAFAACQGGDAQGGPRLPVLIAWAAAGTHPCGPPVAAVAAAAWTLPPVRCRRFYRSSW